MLFSEYLKAVSSSINRRLIGMHWPRWRCDILLLRDKAVFSRQPDDNKLRYPEFASGPRDHQRTLV